VRALWRRLRGLLCPFLGHRYIGDEHRRLCVYCWKEERIRHVPGGGDEP
jgi:hypothetical protein